MKNFKDFAEEVEQLDELGYKTLQSYRQGAHTQIQHYKYAGGKDKPEASSVLAKREAGHKVATDKVVKKDKERIAAQPKREPQKASSYKPLGGRDEKSGRSYSEEVSDKLVKRGANLDKRVKHIQKNLDRRTAGRNYDDAVKRIQSDFDKKMKKEEVEQIDELSKKTLGSYAKKATSSMRGVAASAELAGALDRDNPQREKYQNRALKRVTGVEKAIDRLAKEEVEQVEEGLKPEHNMRPGWMIKADPVLKAKIAANKAKQKEMKSILGKKLKEESLDEGAYEKSEENKRSADSAKKQGDMFAHHLHMADHHDNLAEWHASKGRHGEADKHAEKAEQHQELAMKHKK